MHTQYTIQQLYQLAWGYRGLPYPQGNLGITDPTGTIAQGYTRKNALGREMFMPVTLGDWTIPVEPMVSISGKKRIVSTPLAGNTRRGNVLELVNTESYKIRIRGLLINHNSNAYPEASVQTLYETFEPGESHSIVCDLTRIFEIEKLVIEEIRLAEMVGVQNAQAYELQCISDEDFILIKE